MCGDLRRGGIRGHGTRVRSTFDPVYELINLSPFYSRDRNIISGPIMKSSWLSVRTVNEPFGLIIVCFDF